jgi:hypothetical protein
MVGSGAGQFYAQNVPVGQVTPLLLITLWQSRAFYPGFNEIGFS